MRYLVIGDAGFLGRAFCGSLIEKRHTVLGVDTRPLQGACWDRRLTHIEDVSALEAVIDAFRPTVVINFAVLFDALDREKYFKVNCFSVLELIERCLGKFQLKKSKFVLLGSAAEYGMPASRRKLKENDPLNPINDYGIVKACQTYFAMNLVRQYKAQIVLVRPFNIIGPGLSPNLFLGNCALQIVRIERGQQAPLLQVGNLKSFRDVLSLSKAIEMIFQVSRRGLIGEAYHVSSGRAVKMEDLLQRMLGYSEKKIGYKVNTNRFRKSDVPYVVGANSKSLKLMGKPRFMADLSLDREIKGVLDWYRDNYEENKYEFKK